VANFTWNGVPAGFSDWNTASNWLGGVLPNAANADVVFPAITATALGWPVAYFINVTNAGTAGESLAAAS
jgi:hypothetical protein